MADSIYGQLMDQAAAPSAPTAQPSPLEPAPVQASTPNPYTGIIEQAHADTADVLKANAYAVKDVEPDRQAKIAQLSDSMKLPPDFVARNFDDLQKKATYTGNTYADLMDSSPKTGAWMQDKNNLALVKDDLPATQGLEDHVKDHGYIMTALDAFRVGLIRAADKIAKVPAFAGEAFTQYQNAKSSLFNSVADLTGSDARKQMLKTPEALGDNPVTRQMDTWAKDATTGLPILGASLTKEIQAAYKTGNYERAGKVLIAQTAAALPDFFAAVLAGPEAGLGYFGATAGAENFAENKDKTDLTPENRLLVAGAHGGIMAGAQYFSKYLPFHQWESAITRQFGKQVSTEVMKDFAKTLAATTGIGFVDMAGASLAEDAVDFASGANSDAMQGAGRRAVDAGLGGAAFSVVAAGPMAAFHTVARQQQVFRAQAAKDFYLGLEQKALDMKLRDRHQGAQTDLATSVLKDSPNEFAYIAPEDFETYFQEKNINPVVMAEHLGVLPEFGHAKENGNDLKIPLATMLEKLGGTEHYAGLADDIKFRPEDATPGEAKDEQSRVEDEAKAADNQEAEAAWETLAQQMKASGADDTHVALARAMFDTLGSSEGLTPEQILEQFPLRFTDQSQGEEAKAGIVAPEGQTLSQLSDEEIKKQIEDTYSAPDALEKYNALPETKGGMIIDADAARHLDPEYASGPEGAKRRSSLLDQEAGRFAQRAYEARLKSLPETSPVILLAGGNASGKSTYRDTYGHVWEGAGAVFDSSSVNYKYTKQRIEAAREAGHPVLLNFIFRPFTDAVQGNKERFASTGRLVDPHYIAYTHVGSIDTFLKLAKEYPEDKFKNRVDFEVFNMESGEPVRMTLDQLDKERYNQNGESVNSAAKRLKGYADGQLQEELAAVERAKAQVRRGVLDGSGQEASEDQGRDGSGNPAPQGSGSAAALQGPGKTTLNQNPQGPQVSPLGFYSQLDAEVSKMDFKSMPAQDLLNRIKNIQGVKKDELEALGVNDWLQGLADQKTKVTKEEVQNFIRQNGVQLEQTVLAKDFKGGSDLATEADWDTEPTRDHGDDSSSIESEYEYYSSSDADDMFEEAKKRFYADNIEDYTDENGEVDNSGLAVAWEKDREEQAWDRARESVESDDYHGARYVVEENVTGHKIYGSDEMGWYGSDGQEYSGNLEEAKIQATARLIRDGFIQGDVADLIKPKDIEWRAPTASVAPVQGVVTKKANKLLKEERAKVVAQAEERGYEKDDENDLKRVARQMAQEFYDDPSNPKNTVQVAIRNELISGMIEGNAVKGWTFTVYGKKERTRSGGSLREIKHKVDLVAKDLDGAKAEAIQQLLDKKMITPEGTPAATTVDPNEPTGKSKYGQYSVPGGKNYREILLALPGGKDQFTGGHFSTNNVLAHVRVSDRVDAQGRKTLFLEELQSDWHQQGRERGYKNPEDAAKLVDLREKRRDLEDKRLTAETNSRAAWDELTKKLEEISNGSSETPYTEASNLAEVLLRQGPSAPEPERLAAQDAIGVELYNRITTDPEATDLLAKYQKTNDEANLLTSQWSDIQREIEAVPTDQVPDAPFKQTDAWAALALKRMVRMAVEQGYETLAWTPADVHVDRWGTDAISWHKVPAKFGIVDPLTKELKGSYPTREAAEAQFPNFKFEISEEPAHWLVGSAEQRGGNADGMNIEEVARTRGKLLERDGERVTTKEELGNVIASTLGREKTDRSLGSLTDQVWERMQKENSGAKLPRAEGMKAFYDKLVPDVMKKIVKKIDPEAKIDVGSIETNEEPMKVLEVPLTDKLKETVSTQGLPLFQDRGQGPQGQIDMGPEGSVIRLFAGANKSTAPHELMHYIFNTMEKLSKNEGASDRLKDQVAKLREWVGAEDGKALTVAQQEKIADGFEEYLMEGKSPSRALEQVFQKFKIWMTHIYNYLKAKGVELSPEIRAVYDRVLATDKEIDEARREQSYNPMFTADAITQEKFDKYQEAIDRARIAADNALRAQVMEDIRKQDQRSYKELVQRTHEEVTLEAQSDPTFRAQEILRRQLNPDGTPLPEGTPKLKLDRKAIVAEYGEEAAAALKGYTSRDEGMHPNLVAGLIGYESGDSLVQDLIKRPKMSDWVEHETKQRVEAQDPDLFNTPEMIDKAVQDIHNDQQAKVFRMELEIMQEQSKGQSKDMLRRIARPALGAPELRQQVRQVIGRQVVRELKPQQYKFSEAKWGRQALDLYLKGDLDGAIDAKRLQLYNHELFRVATEARDHVRDSVQDFKRFNKRDEKLAKSRDTNLVNTGRAILAAFGVGKTEDPPSYYLDKLKNYDTDAYYAAANLVQMATANGAGNYNEIPYGRFADMATAVDAIWGLSRDMRQIEIDGKKIAKDKVVSDLSARINDLNKNPDARPGYTQAVTNWDKTKSVLLSAKAVLRRVEHWSTAMDGGDKGDFRTYIWNPVSEAANKFRLKKAEMVAHYLKEVVLPSKEIFAPMKIMAPEINYTFKNKGELLGALIHRGNESNFSKLLRGRHWGDVDAEGNLDDTKFTQMEKRLQADGTLTKADYDYLQGVWDMYETTKVDAQKAHKKLYGYHFDEITAKPFQTPFGEYRGGYAPAVTDPNMVEDQALRREKDALEHSANMTMMPSTGRGFTKSRVEGYAAPLAIDLNYIPMQIDKVLRFTYLEPAVRDVSKIVMDRNFREVLGALDSSVASEMLVPWLQRAASQSVSTPSGTGKAWKAADWIFRKVRGNSGLNAMTLNVINTFHQTTGFSVANTMVENRYLRDAMWSYMKDARGVSQAIQEKSEYMRAKGQNIAALQGEINDLILHPTKYEKGMDFVKQNSYILQHYTAGMVEAVAWSGGYAKGVELGYSELEAVRYADSVVRQTQHSAHPEDVSRFGTGSPFMRMFTMYFDYYNNKANLNVTQAGNILREETGIKKKIPALTALYVSSLMVPAIMSASAYHMAGGKLDENDDNSYLDDVMKIFFGGQVNEALALVPVLGPLVNNQINRFNDNRYDDRLQLSPAIENAQKAFGAPKEIFDAAHGGKAGPAIRDSLSLIGMLSGLPVQPLAKPLGYAADVASGKVKSGGPLDYARGLVTGQGPRAK